MNKAPGTCSCCALPAERRPSRPGGAAPSPARGRQVALCRTKPGAARRSHKAKPTAGPPSFILSRSLSPPCSHRHNLTPGTGRAPAPCPAAARWRSGGRGLRRARCLTSGRPGPCGRAGVAHLGGGADLEQVQPVRVPVVDDVGEFTPLLLPAAAARHPRRARRRREPSRGRGRALSAEPRARSGGGGRQPAGEGPALLSVAAGTGAAETPRDRRSARARSQRTATEERKKKREGRGAGRRKDAPRRQPPRCLLARRRPSPSPAPSPAKPPPPPFSAPLSPSPRSPPRTPSRARPRPAALPPALPRCTRAPVAVTSPRPADGGAPPPFSSFPLPSPGRGVGAGARPGAVAVAAAPWSCAGRQRGAPESSPAGTKIRRGAVYFPVFQRFGEAALPPAQRRPWLARRLGAERGAVP